MDGPTIPTMTHIWKLLYPWSYMHENFPQRYGMGPATELFGEDIWDIDFSRYVQDLYLITMNTLLDVVIKEADMFCTFFVRYFDQSKQA